MVADRVELVTRKAGSAAGARWESHRRGHLHDRGRAATRRRAPRSRCTSSPRTPTTRCTTTPTRPTVREIVKRYSDFITWPIRMARATRRAARSSTRRRRCGRGREGRVRRGVRRVLPARQPRLARAARDDPACRRGHLRVPGPAVPAQPRADRPVHARGQARRAALREARLHHGRLRGARPRVPALRQGRRRRARPLAQHLPGDPPAGPADPADPPAPGQEGARRRSRTLLADEPEKYAHLLDGVRPRRSRKACSSDHDNRDAILEICSFAVTHDAERAHRRCATTSRA